MPSLSPEQRNIVLLGATSEIGQALAGEALKRGGFRILLASRSPTAGSSPQVSQGSDSMKSLSGIDLTVEADLFRLQAAVRDFFCEPFSVVHSVGDFWIHKPLVATDFAEIRSMYESHYLTLCFAARSLIPVLIEAGGGRIVTFSCNSVLYSYPDMAPFTAAKAAIESLVKCLANEYAEHGIAVTALALPTIRTERVLSEKPTGDHDNYLYPADLAKILLDNVLCLPSTVTGNVVKIFKYSPSFYHSSYFDRNPRTKPIS